MSRSEANDDAEPDGAGENGDLGDEGEDLNITQPQRERTRDNVNWWKYPNKVRPNPDPDPDPGILALYYTTLYQH